MDQAFIDILKQLVAEQVNAVLSDTKQFKSLLADYTRNEYKKESRFFVQAVELGVAKAIKEADDLPACKKGKINELVEDYGLSPEVAAAIVDTLALVLRGDTSKSVTATPAVEKAADSQSAPKQEGGSNKIEVNVSFRDREGGMKVECINPFADSASSIFKNILRLKFKRCDEYLQPAGKPITGVAVWIGFTGDLEGRFLLTMSKETALYVASTWSNKTCTVLDDPAKASVNKIAQTIVANTKSVLEEPDGNNINININDRTSFFDNGYTEKDANLVDKDAMVIPFELTEK